MNFLTHRITFLNKTKKNAGLSLVEVALSMSIFAVATIPLIGLLTHGVKTNKLSVEESTLLAIYERTRSSVKVGETGPFYFNSFGESAPAVEAVFEVAVQKTNRTLNDAGYGLKADELYRISITHLPSNTSAGGMLTAFLSKSTDPVSL